MKSRSSASAPVGQVRIIGGKWRNTKLPVPKSPGLRPSSD
ncbi:MAG: RsmD family RNA methyltransferase, partial [Stenotrophomonas sp.]